jgi:hypothetical protein
MSAKGVSYRPESQAKSAKRRHTLDKLEGHAESQATLIVEIEEGPAGPLDKPSLANAASDEAKFRVLRKLEEDDLEFMVYYDLYERDVEDKEAIQQELGQEIEIAYENVSVDPLTFFNNALIYHSKNNSVEGTGAFDLELSFQSLSEVAVERFLAPKDRLAKTNSFLKPWEITSTGLTQGNYTSVWYQDIEDTPETKLPTSKGDFFLHNIEIFPWTRKKFRYLEIVPLTDDEKKFTPYVVPEAEKQIFLDPKIHRTLEKLSEYLRKLKSIGISKKEFLGNLEAMQVSHFLRDFILC